MRQPKPLPKARPFITFMTPTFRRPEALARNLASVGLQTEAERCEQIVFPDHVGYGIGGGLFGRLKWYATAARGRYVHVLQDDDVLAAHDVVARLIVEAVDDPDVMVVKVRKDGKEYPCGDKEGDIDMASYIMRRDVWVHHVNDYGERYAGDFDHFQAMRRVGRWMKSVDLLFVTGKNRNGRPEVDYA